MVLQINIMLFSDLGNDFSSMGVGIKVWNSFYFEVGATNNGNICFHTNNSLFHTGFSVGVDGIGFNIGVNINNRTYDFDINIVIRTIIPTIGFAVLAIYAPGFAPMFKTILTQIFKPVIAFLGISFTF